MQHGWSQVEGRNSYFHSITGVYIPEFVEIDEKKYYLTVCNIPYIEQIKKYAGTPYTWGGSSPSGWDCSGFTQWALNYLGASIPRSAAMQSQG